MIDRGNVYTFQVQTRKQPLSNLVVYLPLAMASILPVLFVLVIIVALMTCAMLFVPKGPQQVLVVHPVDTLGFH